MRPNDLHAKTLSLPEARALVVRAARGAGCEWGVADECGWAAVWLAAQGHDWAEITLDCLSGIDPAGPDVACGVWTGAKPLCPLLTGLALSDFAALPEGPHQGLQIGPLRRPSMLLPFVTRAAALLGCDLAISCEGRQIAPREARALDRLHRAAEVVLTPAARHPYRSPGSLRPDAPLTAAQSAHLDDMAQRTFVPSSARSLAGAGSERSDND